MPSTCLLLQPSCSNLAPNEVTSEPNKGLKLACLIGACWFVSLVVCLCFPVQQECLSVVIALVLLRSFLHTGLFIVAHDAMHQSLAPKSLPLNHRIGNWCLIAYAGLSYKRCTLNHHLHHQSPESKSDPDYHHTDDQSILGWYIHFLGNYIGKLQIIRLAVIWLFLFLISLSFQEYAARAVVLFAILPLIISSWQLFLIGTCLPHRKRRDDYKTSNHPRSLRLPAALSFAACYHFGYHWEHHQFPSTPWYQLPSLNVAYQQHQKSNHHR